MARPEPKKDTPAGDVFDGKIFMGAGVLVFVVLAVLQLWPIGAVVGGVLFVVGALKYHAGLVRRPSED